MRKLQLDQQYWHAVPNDEVGGWAVTNYQTSGTSKLNHEIGQWVVTNFCFSERIARSIADLHNRELDQASEDFLDSFSDYVQIEVKTNGQRLGGRVRINQSENPQGLIVALHNLAASVVRALNPETND